MTAQIKDYLAYINIERSKTRVCINHLLNIGQVFVLLWHPLNALNAACMQLLLPLLSCAITWLVNDYATMFKPQDAKCERYNSSLLPAACVEHTGSSSGNYKLKDFCFYLILHHMPCIETGWCSYCNIYFFFYGVQSITPDHAWGKNRCFEY